MTRIDIEPAELVTFENGIEIPINKDTTYARLLNDNLVPYPSGMEGEYLRYSRQINGAPAGDVIDCIGVSRQTLHMWESGSSTPQPEMMLRLMNLYTYSADAIAMMSYRVSQDDFKVVELEVTLVQKDMEQQQCADQL